MTFDSEQTKTGRCTIEKKYVPLKFAYFNLFAGKQNLENNYLKFASRHSPGLVTLRILHIHGAKIIEIRPLWYWLLDKLSGCKKIKQNVPGGLMILTPYICSIRNITIIIT